MAPKHQIPAKYEVNFWERFRNVEDVDPPRAEDIDYLQPDDALSKAYAAEMVKDRPVDKLREMRINLAMDTYEKQRPKDKVMHHYVIRDAGDPDAIGEYYSTGDERNSCPIYQNARGITLTREKQPVGNGSEEEQYGWILGSIEERRPLYGIVSDDLSVPTLGWQGFTAPGPVPTIRYYSHASASRMFKDKGNAAIQAQEYLAAESWYTKALGTKMDPHEFPEPMGMIHSNRAQARLYLLKYHEAAADAEMALRFLQNVLQMNEPTVMLKQKTYVRRAKALAGMKQYHEAESVMKNAHVQFPGSDCIESCWKEMQVAKRSDTRGQQSGPTGALLRFVGNAVQEVQSLAEGFKDSLADAVFPESLAKTLLKLEYLFCKADGEALTDVQVLFRASGGLRTLMHLVEVQWKSNMEGKHVDMDKLDSLCTVLSILSLASDGQVESISMVSSQVPALFAALGGCNRKVNSGFLCRSAEARGAGVGPMQLRQQGSCPVV
jgi:tetratricopeptide (TPR) repeat protein